MDDTRELFEGIREGIKMSEEGQRFLRLLEIYFRYNIKRSWRMDFEEFLLFVDECQEAYNKRFGSPEGT